VNNWKDLASAELYDPTTSQFTLTGPMIAGQIWATSTRLHDGRVLIAAGGSPEAAELYDPQTGGFTVTGEPQGQLGVQGDATANILPDGRVLVTGTADHAPRAQAYDPATGEFTKLRFSLPGPAKNNEDLLPHLTSTLLANGLVLIYVPGLHQAGAKSYSSYLETYGPATGAFQSAGAISNPGQASPPSATLLSDGRVLFAGGSDSGSSASAAAVYDGSKAPRPVSKRQVGRTYQTATLLFVSQWCIVIAVILTRNDASVNG
jgi:hypothetical protein